MPPRQMGATQSRPWLSWGELSCEPRSLVLDVAGAFMFMGSPVVRADGRDGTGVVVSLESPTLVRVRWRDSEHGAEARPHRADTLRVTGPFDRRMHLADAIPAPRVATP